MFDDPWTDISSPSRLFDQYFGLGLTDDDFDPPTYWRGMHVRPRTRRPAHQTGLSEVSAVHLHYLILYIKVTNDDKEFKMMVDVSHFSPDEITVKSIENRIVINAKHEEKEDEHGFIERSFKRQYVLPKDVDPAAIQSSLTADGVLVIKAAKKAIEPPKERIIPVQIEQDEENEDIEGATGGEDIESPPQKKAEPESKPKEETKPPAE
ncbi:hypothetical protein KUTeg_013324 [Tegillarca granosa]|uniref:SHSP domain-containing protein n=1 Tax=Tegillarca granosa TaxID=220873 RepID=A0ABQ9ETG6_TEGGR|nr:hypothetical protein KUTeg_013324 [Tegillarca granosa]